MTDKITIAGHVHQLAIPSSFLATVDPVSVRNDSANIAEFHLAAGNWLVQVKAHAKTVGDGTQGAAVNLILGIAGTLDRLDISFGHVTSSAPYATLTPMIGIRSSVTTHVLLRASAQGEALIEAIVIAGTKHDELLLLQM